MTDLPQPAAAPGAPIALFDSGVGGLSVLRHIQTLLPAENLLYLADQAHVPYGPRPAAEILLFAEAITRFFLERQAKVIVLACNTATAAALNQLRARFPHVPFIGMEPAVKPGAAQTRTGKVGVLATAGTFESQRYASLMERFASNVTLLQNPCTGLVPLIESGRLEAVETERVLRGALGPMLAADVDTIVLGCTHYPFVQPLIEQIVGEKVTVIDPAPAVARQVQRVLQRAGQLHSPTGHFGSVRAFTTGDPVQFAQVAGHLLGHSPPVTALHWAEDRLVAGTGL